MILGFTLVQLIPVAIVVVLAFFTGVIVSRRSDKVNALADAYQKILDAVKAKYQELKSKYKA